MEYFKILIFTLFVLSLIFPGPAFGFFAEPDRYIHSMPFGVQLESANGPKAEIPDILNTEVDEKSGENPVSTDEAGLKESEKEESGQKFNYFSIFSAIAEPQVIFSFAVFAAVLIYFLLRRKKMI